MRLRQMISWKSLRRHLPPPTVRLRLTVLYSSLFLASAAALLCITDVVWGRATGSTSRFQVNVPAFAQILNNLAPVNVAARPRSSPARVFRVSISKAPAFLTTADPRQQQVVAGQLNLVAIHQQTSDLHQLLLYSSIALLFMVVVAVALGWFMTGRLLRPVRTITAAANDISATNLHERLRLSGPKDELRELGDTFDRLLERLEGAFESQRRFVANASHELRTPLTTMRASLDVAMAKPAPISQESAALVVRLRAELDQVDRLLESFLALARAQRGEVSDTTVVSLGDLARDAIEQQGQMIAENQLRVDQQAVAEATVIGSDVLLARMVDNVIDNAIKHNERGGWVRVTTETEGGTARLVIENGGPVIEHASVAELVQPFKRLGADRTGSETGTGLGLSIVAAIAEAHGGRLEIHGRAEGGLQVVLELPPATVDPGMDTT